MMGGRFTQSCSFVAAVWFLICCDPAMARRDRPKETPQPTPEPTPYEPTEWAPTDWDATPDPTPKATETPTEPAPTTSPSSSPSFAPSPTPSVYPTFVPSSTPSDQPSPHPSPEPTTAPSGGPTASASPTGGPTVSGAPTQLVLDEVPLPEMAVTMQMNREDAAALTPEDFEEEFTDFLNQVLSINAPNHDSFSHVELSGVTLEMINNRHFQRVLQEEEVDLVTVGSEVMGDSFYNGEPVPTTEALNDILFTYFGFRGNDALESYLRQNEKFASVESVSVTVDGKETAEIGGNADGSNGPTSGSGSSNDGLSSGAIAGIILGCTAVVIAAVVLVVRRQGVRMPTMKGVKPSATHETSLSREVSPRAGGRGEEDDDDHQSDSGMVSLEDESIFTTDESDAPYRKPAQDSSQYDAKRLDKVIDIAKTNSDPDKDKAPPKQLLL